MRSVVAATAAPGGGDRADAAAHHGAPSTARPSTHRWRGPGLIVAVIALVLLAGLSLAVGTKAIPLADVLKQIVDGDSTSDTGIVVHTLRLPRTLIGLAVGAALGLAGALMQALTRNPLADPGILGVNAGGSAAVVTAIAVLGVSSPTGYVWFALIGAGVASVVVYVLGSRGSSAATPVRLALAGAAITAALSAFISGLILLNRSVFDSYRFWAVGAIAGRPWEVLYAAGPFLAIGVVLALALARPLNALALGDDTGHALGAHPGRIRAVGVVAVTLLCGGAVAAAGPIGFVGLTIPHIARAITGPDQRWILPYSMVLAPILLLSSDVLGRVIARPGEIEVGIITAFLGAPVFIWIARRSRWAKL